MNIHTKKRNCNRCFAGKHFNYGNGFVKKKCDLGFYVKLYAFDETGRNSYCVPLEKCPKPLTIKDFIFAEKYYNNPNTQTPANLETASPPRSEEQAGGKSAPRP